jgi:hypothetical protein
MQKSKMVALNLQKCCGALARKQLFCKLWIAGLACSGL